MKRIITAVLAAGTLALPLTGLAAATRAWASADAQNSLSPAKTEITATNGGAGDGEPSVYLDGANFGFLAQCSTLSFSFKTPKDGVKVTITDPVMTGCKDGNGGTDTITTQGKWTVLGKRQVPSV